MKYETIASVLREDIRTGVLPPGAKLPSNKALARTYKVSLGTVRRAIDELVRERVVYGRSTSGIYVTEAARRYLTTEIPTLAGLGDQLVSLFVPGAERTQTIEVSHVIPAGGINRRLRLNGGKALLRHRVMSAPDPIGICNAWYPPDLVKDTDLEQPVIIDRGADTVLDEIGLGPVRFTDEWYIRMSMTEENHEIGWRPATPVWVTMRTAYTATDIPVSCGVSIFPADGWILAAERRREPGACIRAVS